MGLRIKLTLPAVAAFLIFATVLHMYWAPRFYDRARTDFINQVNHELTVLEHYVVPYLITGDLSALYASLDEQKQLHSDIWSSISLFDAGENRIYPLTDDSVSPGQAENPFFLSLSRNLAYSGKILGHVAVTADWSSAYTRTHWRILELEAYLAVTLGLLFLTQLIWEHRVVGRPIMALNRATEKLSEGDFSAALPRPSSDEIGQLAQSFEQMRANLLAAREKLEKKTWEAQEASKAKSNFVATMSHEIRTPMNGIAGMAQVLAKTNLDREQQGMVELLSVSCNNLFAVLNDILDFSKIEAGKMELEPIDVDLETLLNEVLALLGKTASQKGISLELAYEKDCPRHVKADGGRLRQIILNLLSNGVKFTEKGGVTVSVSCLEQGGDSCRFRFEVTDTGMGIAPEKQQEIFDSFTQADTSTTRTHGGTGLGLAISRSLVALMGGDLAIESSPGKGSAFSFEIWLEKATPLMGRRSVGAEKEEQTLAFTGDLLLVEDNPVNQKVIQKMLARTRIRVDLAQDGQQAVEMAKQKAYDLVLMDYQMPVMDGITATRKIRAWEMAQNLDSVPIIALTANVLRQNQEACAQAGMNGFLAKPVTVEAIWKMMETWLSGPAPGSGKA